MGFELHSLVIAELPISDERRLEALRDLADFRDGVPEKYRHLIVGPVAGVVNGYEWIAFFPDGSKEGWEASIDWSSLRRAFAARFGGMIVRWGDTDPSAVDGLAFFGPGHDDPMDDTDAHETWRLITGRELP